MFTPQDLRMRGSMTKTPGRSKPRHSEPPTTAQRVAGAFFRRVRLLLVRLRHPRAQFGRGCDVRPRLELRMSRRAQARFGTGCVIDKDATVEVEGTLVVGDRTI